MLNNSFGTWVRPLAFFVILLAHTDATVLALENQTAAQGSKACIDWCNAHRTGDELSKCKDNCIKYWSCNGSDAKTNADAIALCGSYGSAAQTTVNPTKPKPTIPGLTTGRTPQQQQITH